MSLKVKQSPSIFFRRYNWHSLSLAISPVLCGSRKTQQDIMAFLDYYSNQPRVSWIRFHFSWFFFKDVALRLLSIVELSVSLSDIFLLSFARVSSSSLPSHRFELVQDFSLKRFAHKERRVESIVHFLFYISVIIFFNLILIIFLSTFFHHVEIRTSCNTAKWI